MDIEDEGEEWNAMTNQWDQGSLGQMRVESLLTLLGQKAGKPIVWLPGNAWNQEIVRECDANPVYGEPGDESTAIALRKCLMSIAWQMGRDFEWAGSLIVDVPDRWPRMYTQGTAGPVRIGLTRDVFDFRLRVGVRVKGIPYMLEGPSPDRIAAAIASRVACRSTQEA